MIEAFFIFRLLTNKWKNNYVSGVFQLWKLRNMRPLLAGSSGPNLPAKVIVTASTSADGAIIQVTTSDYCSIVKVAISAEVPHALYPQLVVYCKSCDLC